jgi:two-component system, OmpR family, sensor histidine kinase TctE
MGSNTFNWQQLDPRRGIAARVAAVSLAGAALAWWLPAAQMPIALLSAAGAAALAVRPWRQLARDIDATMPVLCEVQPVVQAWQQRLAEQQAVMERHKRFLADASHQLRTPLAVLRTQLQSDNPTTPRAAEMLRTLDRATAVADELLSRLKVEQHQSHGLRLQSLRLDQVAQDAALEFSPLIAKSRQAFELDAVPLDLRADAWMLGELVRNLLANAVRHTPPGGDLGIVVRRAAGCAELIVWDSGTGVADDQRERLFEPFAAAAGGTGVGLGLSICRQLALAMGAQVQLFNRSDGARVVGLDAVVRWLPTPELLSSKIS